MIITRFSKIKAKDRRFRYVTTVLVTVGLSVMRWGVSIATAEHHKEKRGKEIALARAKKPTRKKLSERNLRGDIFASDHVPWLEKNKPVLHGYADYLHNQTCQNLNDIIWPES